jgi:hypothetical protein
MNKKTFVVNIYNGRILEQAKASKALVKLSQKLYFSFLFIKQSLLLNISRLYFRLKTFQRLLGF